MRADIPLGLDLLPVFWKNLVGVPLDPITDLQEADIITYNYIKKFEMVRHARIGRYCYTLMKKMPPVSVQGAVDLLSYII